MTPAFAFSLSFDNWNLVPSGRRAVIKLVTATISVPAGEWARLRMYTSLGMVPSNLDLVLTSQGTLNGMHQLVATHSLRAYTDHTIDFGVGRDNATTAGRVFVCISGYLV